MEDIKKILPILQKEKKLLAIFPHPDDESFVAGGLFQKTNKFNISTKLITLTKAGTDRHSELKKAAKILGIDDITVWNFPEGNLAKNTSWVKKISAEIKLFKPEIILTFDPSGITGHPDHIVTCLEVFRIVKGMEKRPNLLWRVPDDSERKFFSNNPSIKFAKYPSHALDYNLFIALKKIKAIYSYKTRMKNFGFKLQILEWYLFDHREYYHQVDFDKEKTLDYKVKSKR